MKLIISSEILFLDCNFTLSLPTASIFECLIREHAAQTESVW